MIFIIAQRQKQLTKSKADCRPQIIAQSKRC